MSTQTTTTNVPSFELRHRLALSLEASDLRAEDIATEIGRGVTTVRNYLSGRTTPSRAVLIAWSLRCGVSLQWLETGEVIDLRDGPDSGPGQDIPGYGWIDGTPGELIVGRFPLSDVA